MHKVDTLRNDVQSILDSMRTFVETASDLSWNPTDGFLPVVRRAVLRRQFESLDAVAHLVAEERGYAAVPLLRPSCEELIWVKYLGSIGTGEAEELLRYTGNIEIIESLKVQDNYAGRTVSKQLGLLPALEGVDERRDAIRKRLAVLGKKLNWDRRKTKNGQLPTMKWLANATGQTADYNFIYHATSRFVHFSCAELLRRAWGRPGKMSIRSIHFRDYWGSFALYWGLRLFINTATELCGAPGMPINKIDEASLLAAAERVGAHGQVPIITAEELAWPEQGG